MNTVLNFLVDFDFEFIFAGAEVFRISMRSISPRSNSLKMSRMRVSSILKNTRGMQRLILFVVIFCLFLVYWLYGLLFILNFIQFYFEVFFVAGSSK